MKLTVIIPVYNEEHTCAEIIRRVRSVPLETQVLVINDGSSDHTAAILTGMDQIDLITHSHNLGKGTAIRSALNHIRGDYVILQDGDLEYDPQDYQHLLEPLVSGQTDAVFGSRFLNKPIRWTFHYWGNRTLTWFANLLNGGDLTDMATCYKVMPSRLLASLDLKSRGFGIDAEITAKLTKRGYRIRELPIAYQSRGIKDGKKIRWWDGIVAVWSCIKYRIRG